MDEGTLEYHRLYHSQVICSVGQKRKSEGKKSCWQDIFLFKVQSVNTLLKMCLPWPKESFASHSSFWTEQFQNSAEEIAE